MSYDTACQAPQFSGETSETSGSSPSGGGARGALRSSLKGRSFDEGASMLAPVQRRAKPHAPATPAVSPGASAPIQMEEAATAEDPEFTGFSLGPGASGPGAIEAMRVQQDFGEVATVDEAVAVVGGFLETCAPQPGVESEVELKLSIAMEGVYLDWKLKGTIQRTAVGLEMELTNTMTVGIGLIAEGGKAYCGVRGAVGTKVKGDSGYECLQLFSLSIYEWLCNQDVTVWDVIGNAHVALIRASGGGRYIAQQIWSGDFEARVLEDMDPLGSDEADTIESTGTLSAAGGASLDLGVDDKAKVDMEVGARTTTTMGKDDSGELVKSEKTELRVVVKLEGPGFEGELKVTGDQSMQIELEIELPDFEGEELMLFAEAVFEMVAGQVQPVLEKSGDVVDEDLVSDTLRSVPRAAVTAGAAAAGVFQRKIGVDLVFSGAAKSVSVHLIHATDIPPATHGSGAVGASLEGGVKTKTQVAEVPI